MDLISDFSQSLMVCAMRYCQVVLVWSAVALVAAPGRADDSLRSVGGRDALPDEFPYVVRLQIMKEVPTQDGYETKEFFTCTAPVLKPTWSLTAAHCVTSSYAKQKSLTTLPETLVLRYGSPDGKPSEHDQYSRVIEIVDPPMRRPNGISNDDIVMLRHETIELSQYLRLSSIDYKRLYGAEVTALGYGCTDWTQPRNTTFQSKKPLQVLKLMLNECDDNIKIEDIVYPKVCYSVACNSEYTWPCNGDSGGPVVHRSGLVAIHTNGFAHGAPAGIAKIYNSFNAGVPVSLYYQWITDQMLK